MKIAAYVFICNVGTLFLVLYVSFVGWHGSDMTILQKEQCEHAFLKRKMSLKRVAADRLYESILGARIEVSHDAAFTQPDLLYQFNDTLWGNYLELPVASSGKKYRYLRYVILPGKWMELAELSVYKDSLGKQPIALRRMNNIEPIAELDKITDGNILTFFRRQIPVAICLSMI